MWGSEVSDAIDVPLRSRFRFVFRGACVCVCAAMLTGASAYGPSLVALSVPAYLWWIQTWRPMFLISQFWLYYFPVALQKAAVLRTARLFEQVG